MVCSFGHLKIGHKVNLCGIWTHFYNFQSFPFMSDYVTSSCRNVIFWWVSLIEDYRWINSEKFSECQRTINWNKENIRFSCARKGNLNCSKNYFLKYLWWIIHPGRWDILPALQLTGCPTENWNSHYGGTNKNHRKQDSGDTLSVKVSNSKSGVFCF